MGPHEWSRNPRKGEGLPQRLRGVGQQEAHRLAAHPLHDLFFLPITWKMKEDKIRLVCPGRGSTAGRGQGEPLGGCSPGLRVVCGGSQAE